MRRLYAQAGLSLCWSHIPHCWKSHALAQLVINPVGTLVKLFPVHQYSVDIFSYSGPSEKFGSGRKAEYRLSRC